MGDIFDNNAEDDLYSLEVERRRTAERRELRALRKVIDPQVVRYLDLLLASGRSIP